MTPAWILDILAALMLVVAGISAARLVEARPWQRGSALPDTDLAHLLMGIAMAGMLVSGLTTLPNTAWVIIFAVLTAWFAFRVAVDASANGARALAGGHCASHLAQSAAMVYMFAALAAPAAGGAGMSGIGGVSGMQTLRYPTLAFVFALILIGYSVWGIDQLPGRRYSTTPAPLSLARVGATVPAMVPMTGAEPATVTLPSSRAIAVSAIVLSRAVTVSSRIAIGVTIALMLFLII
jgi:hypothetical protein